MLAAALSSPVSAALLQLSDYSSDGSIYNVAEYLSAGMNFVVAGSTLTLTVTNNTFYDPNTDQTTFDIDELFFNIDPVSSVTDLTLTHVWEREQDGKKINGDQVANWTNGVSLDGFHVNGFGLYDVQLVADDPPIIPPADPAGLYSVEFVFAISGTGPFSDADFTTSFSTRFDGGPEILGFAAGKFVHGGPDGWDESAYGVVVPEPTTICLLGFGVLGLLLRKRRT